MKTAESDIILSRSVNLIDHRQRRVDDPALDEKQCTPTTQQ